MDTIFILVMIAAYYLLGAITMTILFKKGGVKRFLAWIPVINYVYLLKMVDLKWYHIFEFLVTIGVCLLCFYLNGFKVLSTTIIFAASAFLFDM